MERDGVTFNTSLPGTVGSSGHATGAHVIGSMDLDLSGLDSKLRPWASVIRKSSACIILFVELYLTESPQNHDHELQAAAGCCCISWGKTVGKFGVHT